MTFTVPAPPEPNEIVTSQRLGTAISPLAHTLLDQRDRLAGDDRTAGLPLFAQLTRNPERQRDTERGMGR